MCRILCYLVFLVVILGVAGPGRAGLANDPACVFHFSFDDFRRCRAG